MIAKKTNPRVIIFIFTGAVMPVGSDYLPMRINKPAASATM
jgi:hypothetical protein